MLTDDLLELGARVVYDDSLTVLADAEAWETINFDFDFDLVAELLELVGVDLDERDLVQLDGVEELLIGLRTTGTESRSTFTAELPLGVVVCSLQ